MKKWKNTKNRIKNERKNKNKIMNLFQKCLVKQDGFMKIIIILIMKIEINVIDVEYLKNLKRL